MTKTGRGMTTGPGGASPSVMRRGLRAHPRQSEPSWSCPLCCGHRPLRVLAGHCPQIQELAVSLNPGRGTWGAGQKLTLGIRIPESAKFH